MLKVVIVDPFLDKNQQERLKLAYDIPARSLEFTSTLEDYLGCSPSEVVQLGNLSEEDYFKFQSSEDTPLWIAMNYSKDSSKNVSSMVMNEHCMSFKDLTFLKKRGSTDRYVFYRPTSDYLNKYGKSTYEILMFQHSELSFSWAKNIQLAFVQTDNLMGFSNGMNIFHLPYRLKTLFSDEKSHIIMDMNTPVISTEDISVSEDVWCHYSQLNERVVANFKVLKKRFLDRPITLSTPGSVKKSFWITHEFWVLLSESIKLMHIYTGVHVTVSSNISKRNFADIYLYGTSDDKYQKVVEDYNDIKVTTTYYWNESEPKHDNLSTSLSWALSEYRHYIAQNSSRLSSMHDLLKGNGERIEALIDGVLVDLESSALDDNHKKQYAVDLEYIQKKMIYLSLFTDCFYNCFSHKWTTKVSPSKIVEEIGRFSHLYNCLDSDYNIQITVEMNEAVKAQKIDLPPMGMFAIFNIMESIIRNTIKHEKKEAPVFTFVWKMELEADGIGCTFYWLDSKTDEKTIQNIRRNINAPLVNKDGNIINSYLGLKELRASICYLYSGESAIRNNSQMYVNPAKTVIETGNGNWGYHFKLCFSGMSNTRSRGTLLNYENPDLMAWSAIMARNFSHNIGSHCLVTLIKEIDAAMSSTVNDEEKHMLVCLKTTYEYIRNKGDFLASFAFSNEKSGFHTENMNEIFNEIKDYYYVFSKISKRSNWTFEFMYDSPESSNQFVSLPESGRFGIFNLIEKFIYDSPEKLEHNLKITCVGKNYFSIKWNDNLHELIYDNEMCSTTQYLLLDVLSSNCSRFEKSLHFNLEPAKHALFVVPKGVTFSSAFDYEEIDRLEDKIKNYGYIVPHDFLVFLDIETSDKGRFLGNIPVNHLPLRMVEMNLSDINAHTRMVDIWKVYIFENLIKERVCNGISVNSDKEYNLISIGRKKVYSGNHGIASDLDRKNYYYNEAASSYIQKYAPLYHCYHSPYFKDATSLHPRSEIWKEMDESKKNKWLLDRYTIFDYTTLPVVIFDERIQECGKEGQLFEHWKLMQIYVPQVTDIDNLCKVSSLDEFDNFLAKVSGQLSQVHLQIGYGAIVFHESLLNSWCEKNGKTIESYLEGFMQRHPCMNVFLTTGRGKSQFLMNNRGCLDHLRFVQFTPLETACKLKNKYKIYNLLISAKV